MEITKRMAKRGTVLLVLMTVGSLFLRSLPATLGVLVGGLLALGDFWLIRRASPWLVRSGGGGILFFLQILKYLVMSVILGAGFFVGLINPLAALVGLSLLIIMPISGIWDLKREMKEVV